MKKKFKNAIENFITSYSKAVMSDFSELSNDDKKLILRKYFSNK